MLITNKAVTAFKPEPALRLHAGVGAGAFLSEGVLAGSPAGDTVAVRALPRLRWAAAAGADSAVVRGGYQPTSRTQFEHTTLIDPVAKGGVGPHPAREPV